MPIQLDLTQSQLDQLYQWVDQLQLSRPKKNINRDYSDALMMAETIQQFVPKLIQIHNYPATNSMKGKISNWKMLNNKALSKLGLDLSSQEIQKLAQSVPMFIEGLLYKFKQNIIMVDQYSNKINRKQSLNQPERKFSMKKNEFENSQKLTKAQQLRQILTLLKEKVHFLQKGIIRKDTQIKQLEEIIRIQSSK